MSTVRKRGDAWQALVRVRKDGEMLHQETRTFTGDRAESLARDWADRLEARLAEGGVAERKLSSLTVGQLLRRYLESRSKMGTLHRNVTNELEQLATEFNLLPLSKLKSETLTKFAMRRRDEGAGGATVMHNLATLRSVLNAAKPMYSLDIDGTVVAEAISVLTRQRVVHRSTERDRRPTADELTRLAAEFDRIAPHPSTVIPMTKIVALAVAFPRRLGELTDMKWRDLKSNVITLRDTKNPVKPRTEKVPVQAKAAAIISSLPVFDERILPYKSESISASFQRACIRLNIDDLRFHDLRHEGITRMFEAGLEIQEVAMISGHLSWNMLKRYTHLQPQSVLDKLNASQPKTPKITA